MKKLGLNELREEYLSFFESKDHFRMPSFSLIPDNDPSILLINAGMTPLKPYFTGQQVPPSKRVTTCQKCIRTPDIENVGKTSRHGTFFEMLGNFSFGDYFKKEAIEWAWEFLTEVLGIPQDKLYVSIYFEDDETFDIWNKQVGLPKEKIFRMGKEDNFWEHGIGPCGPCSEIHYDRGKDKGCGDESCTVGCECDRFIEVWNLVFTQFYRQADMTYVPLKSQNIDTGMGLERLACVVQEVDNIFEVDTNKHLLDYVCNIARVQYGKDAKVDVSIRVITDHIKSSAMMISDGVLPSNEGRGYVLRRLIRRAARHGRLLGINEAFLSKLADTVIDVSMNAYPHMDEKRDYIKKVISIEEEKFYNTVDQGMSILEQHISDLNKQGKTIISGDVVFKLHDTYGFPIDLTREIAHENAMNVDEDGFNEEMKKQKEKAREAYLKKEGSAWEKDLFTGENKLFTTEFTGYNDLETTALVKFIINNGELVDNAQMDEEITIVLDKTPFYAESGGQIGDTGVIVSKNFEMSVDDCKVTSDGKYLHIGKVKSGMVQLGEEVTAKIDIVKRKSTARNHTSTHILQKALKNVVGEHVNQAGSFVAPERLRFDFTHFSQLTQEQIEQVEQQVNEIILANYAVSIKEMPIDKAKELGVVALFGEKYGDIVRVVSVGDYSKELCGGTHIYSTGEIGLIKIISENGIASGVRRIEALTGMEAISWYKEQEKILKSVADIVKTTPEETSLRVSNLIDELKNTQKELKSFKEKVMNKSVDGYLDKVEEISGINVLATELEQMDMVALRNMADTIKNKIGSSVVVLASALDGRVNLVVSATKEAVLKGVNSGKVISQAAKAVGGGGGGRPDMAQAGGKNPNDIEKALEVAVRIIKEQLI